MYILLLILYQLPQTILCKRARMGSYIWVQGMAMNYSLGRTKTKQKKNLATVNCYTSFSKRTNTLTIFVE